MSVIQGWTMYVGQDFLPNKQRVMLNDDVVGYILKDELIYVTSELGDYFLETVNNEKLVDDEGNIYATIADKLASQNVIANIRAIYNDDFIGITRTLE